MIKTKNGDIETVEELRKIMPVLVMDKNYLTIPSRKCCLCPIDIERTAQANGFAVEYDGMDYKLK